MYTGVMNVIRLFVIGTALLYGHALIGCVTPGHESFLEAESLSVSATLDSVPFHNEARPAMYMKLAAMADDTCPEQKAQRL